MLSWIENASQLGKDVKVEVHDESDHQSALALVIKQRGTILVAISVPRGPNYGGQIWHDT